VTSLAGRARRSVRHDGESHAFAGNVYYGSPMVSAYRPNEESSGRDFANLIAGGYGGNSVIFACELTRLSIFSEARFQFRRSRYGKLGDLFGTQALEILERPWVNGVTGDLLARMLLDADFAGSSFVARPAERPDRLRRMRPDWVSIVLGSRDEPDRANLAMDADVLGYMYHPGGVDSGMGKVRVLLADEVSHFAPTPDPLATYRGMAWLTPVIREIEADSAATEHKLAFFRNGASPQVVVALGPSARPDQVTEFAAKMNAQHKGALNAYKTLYVGGGADVTVVGRDLRQLDFKVTQGAGETRIAAAAQVHPTIVGLSEGLAGSSLNAGNFAAARRLVADKTIRPLWRNVCGALSTIVDVPSDAILWFDESNIAFLREDRKDAAEIQRIKASQLVEMVNHGWEWQSSLQAVVGENLSYAKHTGMLSVQLQPPLTMEQATAAVAAGAAVADPRGPLNGQRRPSPAGA
jgi:hypothetical protein